MPSTRRDCWCETNFEGPLVVRENGAEHMSRVDKQCSKDPRIVFAEQVVGVGGPRREWRWFIDDD